MAGLGNIPGPSMRSCRWARHKYERMAQKRLVLVLIALLSSVFAWADTHWFGLYMQGTKIGYTRTTSTVVDAKPAVERRDSKTVVTTQMLGQEMQIEIETSTWIDRSGRPTRMVFKNTSAGRVMTVDAEFLADKVVANVDSNGSKFAKTVAIPADAKLMDDPSESFLRGGLPKPGSKTKGYVFAPDMLDLVLVTVEVKGKTKVEVGGVSYDSWHIVLDDPRAQMQVFASEKGDVIKVTGPMGMELRPETEAVATSFTASRTDLADASSLRPTGMGIDTSKSKLTLSITGADLSAIPSDFGQSATKVPGGWNLVIKPILAPNEKTTILAAGKQMAKWTKPEPRVQSDDPEFVDMAKRIVAGKGTVVAAAKEIYTFVHGTMQVNAGIGVLRDAKEIWKTKEGVCRDHAILTGTLMRAAGIPTRFVNGLVFAGDAYYYHAWVEYWEGSQWVGMDTTRGFFLNVGYIKTSQGSASEALKGFLLDGAKIEVKG